MKPDVLSAMGPEMLCIAALRRTMECMSSSGTVRIIDELLASEIIPLGVDHPCPYLPGRTARHRAFRADEVHADLYQAMMDRGFRRSGSVFYRPECTGCTECRSIRVPASEFRPSKGQRRILRANRDIRVVGAEPMLTDEKWELYRRYLEGRHNGVMSDEYEDLRRFLYDSPVTTVEFCYYLAGTLVGVSLADRSSRALSSVYMFFDPECRKRSLGTFSILWELEYCRREGLEHYYLGYYVSDCRAMNYKARFRPHQLLDSQCQWI